MPAKPLTPEQKADAERLNARFKARKLEEPGLTQAVLADDLGFSTQSAVSQYLRGEVPLNVEAAVRFAERLGCMVSDFSPTMQQAIDRIATFSSAAGRAHRQSEFIPTPEEIARGRSAGAQLERDNAMLAEYLSVADKYRGATPERQAVVDFFLLENGKSLPMWADADARAYADSLEMKAHRWIAGGKSDSDAKTGT